MVLSVAVAGSSGRLGSLVCEIVEKHRGFELVERLTSASDADAGAGADILFDVTNPEVSPGIVQRAIERGQKVVVGTSGWSAARLADLEKLVAQTPDAGVIVIPNFSLGSVLGTALAQIAAPYFNSIEIIEAHHADKVDSPSGTAVRTAEVMAEARAAAGADPLHSPFADQPARGEQVSGVPIHSLRLAGTSPKQEVRFSGLGEVLSIVTDTYSNDAYNAGIRATLEAAYSTQGLVVGLDRVLGIGTAL